MPSAAISGVGSQFKRGDGEVVEVFAVVAEVTGITGPGFSREMIDVSTVDAANAFREKITGFRDAGQVTLALNYNRAEYVLFYADFLDDDPVNYQVILKNGDMWEFAAFVTELPIEAPGDDKVSNNTTFEITGEPTFTPGA